MTPSITKEVIDQKEAIYDRQVKIANEREFLKPAWSAIVGMLLRKGLKAYKLEDKRGSLNR